jgi:uncharacterized protein YycO
MIFLYKGISPISRAIVFRTRVSSWLPDELAYSHAAWGTSDTTVVEAWKDGVREVQFERDHRPGTIVDLYHINLAREQVEGINDFLRAQIGKPYDWLGILGFLVRSDRAHRKTKWFCSELIAEALDLVGKPLLSRCPAHRMLPGMIALSPYLEYAGTRICRAQATSAASVDLTGAFPCIT